jgi:hypothetical protein
MKKVITKIRSFSRVGVMNPKVKVYVKSMKVPAGEKLVEELYPIKRGYSPSRRDTFYKVKLKKVYSYILPDEQKTLIGDVKRLSEQYGFELKVIDVSKEDPFDPWVFLQKVWRRLRGIKNFPVVETKRGGRLQAPFSQGELEKFISDSVPPTD